MTVSKASHLAARFKELNQVNNQLLADGSIARVIKAYYEKYQ